MPGFDWHWIQKIAKGRGEWLTLLFSLLLALSIWTIHNLSLRYSKYVQYTLNVRTNIEGRAMAAESEDAVILRARASGYDLMLQKRNSVLNLNLEPKYFHQVSPASDTFVVYVSEVKGQIEEQVLAKMSAVENYSTELVRFVLPCIETKKVPVIAQSEISYSSQYMATSDMALSPDSILISGEEEAVNMVDAVYTDIISAKNVKKRVQGIVNIIPVLGVEVSQSQILYTQEVGRYIEQSIELPLEIVNVPNEKELLILTTKVKMVYRQLLSSHKAYREGDFRCVIDYKEAEKAINSQAVPHLTKAPKGIYSVTFDPPCVDCIILDKR